MTNTSAQAHALLNLLLSKAVLKGEVGKMTVHLPLNELLEEQDGTDMVNSYPNAHNIVLKLTLTVDWEAADEVELGQVESDMQDVEDVDTEEIEEPENEPDTRKNKKGH